MWGGTRHITHEAHAYTHDQQRDLQLSNVARHDQLNRLTCGSGAAGGACPCHATPHSHGYESVNVWATHATLTQRDAATAKCTAQNADIQRELQGE